MAPSSSVGFFDHPPAAFRPSGRSFRPVASAKVNKKSQHPNVSAIFSVLSLLRGIEDLRCRHVAWQTPNQHTPQGDTHDCTAMWLQQTYYDRIHEIYRHYVDSGCFCSWTATCSTLHEKEMPRNRKFRGIFVIPLITQWPVMPFFRRHRPFAFMTWLCRNVAPSKRKEVPKFEYVSLANWWFQPLTHPSKPIFSERVVQMYAKKTTVQNNRAVKFLLPRNMGLQSHCPRFYLLRSLVLEGGPLYGTTKTFGGRMDGTGILIVLTLTLTLTCRPRLCRFVKKSYICNLCGLRHG